MKTETFSIPICLVVLISTISAQTTSKPLVAEKPVVKKQQQKKDKANPRSKSKPKTKQLPWLDSLAAAYRHARRHDKPILVRFEGQSCPYCKQLAKEIEKPIAQDELKRWTLVRLDIDKSPADARLLAVGPIPALRLLTPTGKIVQSQDGTVSAEKLVEWLQKHLEIASILPDESLTSSGTPDALTVVNLVKQFHQRDAALREIAIRRLMPYPEIAAVHVVNTMSDGSLASQLASLELLKEWKAPVEKIDPWNPKSLTLDRLKKLVDWAEKTDHSKSRPKKTKLTAAELESAKKTLTAMLSANTEEARAMRERLSRFGKLLRPEVIDRLKTVRTDEERKRLTALRYRLVSSDRLVLDWPGGIDRLATTDEKIRQQAVDELAKRATQQEEDLLLELFSDPAPLVREMALKTLRKVGGTNTNSALIRLLSDPEPNVRAAVLKQLSENPSASIVPKIAEYVEEEQDSDLVVHAVRVFREAKGEASTEALLKLLSHSSWQVRAASTEAIAETLGRSSLFGSSNNKAIYLAFVDLLKDEDSFVVSKAIAALSKANFEAAVEPLAETASRHPDLAAEVVKVLSQGSSQSVKAIPYLRKFCTHDRPEVRAAAIGGLCAMLPNVKKELEITLKDKESSVRTAAANALFTKATTGNFVGSHSAMEFAPVITSNSGGAFSKTIDYLGNFFAKKPVPQTIKKDKAVPPDAIKKTKTLQKSTDGKGENITKAKTDEQKSENSPIEILDLAERRTLDYENNLTSIRAGKGKKKWMFELVPLLEPLLKSESVDERMAGALALIALGKDKLAIPVLHAAIESHPLRIPMVSSALPWLLWDDRIDLFNDLFKDSKSTKNLSEVATNMARPADKRTLPIFWEILSRKDVDAVFSYTIMKAITQIYFPSHYYNLEQVTSAARKRATEDLLPKTQSGSRWQRIVALIVLLKISRGEAAAIAKTVVEDDSSDSELRRDAFRILLVAQTITPGTKTAIEHLTQEDPAIRKIALVYLSRGAEAVNSIGEGYLTLRNNLSTSFSSSDSSEPILPKAPEGVKEEMLIPILQSDDAETAAYAGYLLVLLDRPEGLSKLIEYWKNEQRNNSDWTRLVYRAIAYLDDSSYVSLLTEIYEKDFEKDDYTYGIKEFYWTIRVMNGPKILTLRKRIRDNVGIARLR